MLISDSLYADVEASLAPIQFLVSHLQCGDNATLQLFYHSIWLLAEKICAQHFMYIWVSNNGGDPIKPEVPCHSSLSDWAFRLLH